MSRKSYRPYTPRQSMMFPPSPMDWLPEGHLAYFVLDLCEELDLSEIERAIQSKNPRGNRPYPPSMMVPLLVYTWCIGLRSSRAIHQATWTDVAVRVVAGDNHPHFTTLAEFRRTHAEALAKLFEQVLAIAQKAGMVKLDHVAIDGTKIQANASKHKAMSYGRMQATSERLREEVRRILDEAEETDRREDAELGVDNDGTELPEELRRRKSRIARIKEAMAELELEAAAGRAKTLREQAERAEAKATDPEVPTSQRKAAATRARARREQAEQLAPEEADDEGEPAPSFQTAEGLPLNRPPVDPDGTPKPKAQRNFTDPDSRIMESKGSFIQGYNCQAAVDDGHQIVVACAVSNQAPDSGNLVPMVELTKDNCGQAPETVTADTGYWAANVEARCKELGSDALVATGRKRRSEPDPPIPDPESLPDDASAKQRMTAKRAQPSSRDIYRRRKYTVEPVFGQTKEARRLRRFHRRGLTAVAAEWKFDCTCHNILKLFRAGWSPPAKA